MTGGVRIWEGSHDFEPGYKFEKDKNLKRKIKTFKTNDMVPKKVMLSFLIPGYFTNLLGILKKVNKRHYLSELMQTTYP